MSMDTISDNTSGTDDTLRAAFEEHRRETRETRELLERSRFSLSSKSDEHIAWLAYRAGYEHAIAKAAATVAAMIISPTDIILCADTIDEAAARIRALGTK